MDSLPVPSSELQNAWDAFLDAAEQVRQAMLLIAGLGEAPSLKKMGMAAGSLLFRCRLLSAKWMALLALAGEPSGVLKPETPTAPVSMPVWPVSDGARLAELCIALTPHLPAREMPYAPETVDRFRLASDLVDGPGGLISCLSAIQEEITRRIFQEDLAR